MRSTKARWLSRCLTLICAYSAHAAEFEWVPVTATGAHTINGNTIVLDGGGQQVTIDLRMSGWDPDMDNNPLLAAFQATVDSSGYSSGAGAALNPLGWPGSPLDGAFQILNRCTIDFMPDPNGAPCEVQADCPGEVCIPNLDFVFSGASAICDVGAFTLDYDFGCAAQTGGAADDGTTFYGGTIILEVPVNAAGSYSIGFVDDPNRTFMRDVNAGPITDIILTPAGVTVEPPPSVEPPVRADPPHDILKNRYISIDPRGAMGTNPSNLHIRVMVDSSEVIGLIGSGPWWANQPAPGWDLCQTPCISVVTTTKPASEPDWTGCDTAHLTGCPIIPTTTYAIAAESGGILSADALLATQAKPGDRWHGDCVGFFDGANWTPPNLTVSIDDAFAGIKTFQDCSAVNATHLSVTDMYPDLNATAPNLQVGINDVFAIILGFQGQEYPGPDLTQCP